MAFRPIRRASVSGEVRMSADTVHDVIVIGSGPAGYTAAL
ncbi:thioredoxin-disulfide reductase, partial [Mycobacterium helveticum]